MFYFSSSTLAGIFTVLLTNPIWVVKTRMELQSTRKRYYTSSLDAFNKIISQEGLNGLYKGITPALLLCLNGGIQFMIYESLKDFVNPSPENNSKFGIFFALGVVSKATASFITYPYQVVKTRIQQRQETKRYVSTLQTFKLINKTEGWRALYKGLLPNLIRVAPNSAVTLLLYEFLKSIQ